MISKTKGDLLYLLAGAVIGKLLPGDLNSWQEHIQNPEKRPWLMSACWIVIILAAVLWMVSKDE